VVREMRDRRRTDDDGPGEDVPVTHAVEDPLPAPRPNALVP
jgi:hypothetical protein